MIAVPERLEGETELQYLRRKEAAWGLWQADALERMAQQDQTIDALQARLSELEATLRTVADHAHATHMAVVRGRAELQPDDLSRDISGHINIMAAHGDPDYMRGKQSCRHVDTRQRRPRQQKGSE